jgi:hypothetical protein
MTQYTIRFTLAAAVLAASVPQARAGEVIVHEVQVSGEKASGSLHAARHSADSVQMLGCSVKYNAAFGTSSVTCTATDESGRILTCSSSDPGFIPVAAGISDYSWIFFECDKTKLVALTAAKISYALP